MPPESFSITDRSFGGDARLDFVTGPTPTRLRLGRAERGMLLAQELLDPSPRERRVEKQRRFRVRVRQKAPARSFDRSERRVARFDRSASTTPARPEPPDASAADRAEPRERMLAKEPLEQLAVARVSVGSR